MNIHCGVDIVEVSRFVKILEEDNKPYIDKCFTEDEIRYCFTAKAVKARAERFAARFAAKEAVGKALGTGVMTEGIGLRDIEVIKNEKGAPDVKLAGAAKEHAELLGVCSISLSLSHDGGIAVAECVMLAEK